MYMYGCKTEKPLYCLVKFTLNDKLKFITFSVLDISPHTSQVHSVLPTFSFLHLKHKRNNAGYLFKT